MGAWSADVFGNDDACDWAFGLEDANDLSLVESTLETVLSQGTEYVEAPEASEALAAIEAIARLQGNWGERNPYTEPVDEWVEKTKLQPSAALAKKAHLVIERILAENSELKELWQESDEFETWLAFVAELKSRVNE
ncbi:MAG: DUF4259 domain-containing protein [Thiobacillus sp.]|uniref:DUF4259 domain-containing protein n=1 Tax=Thiobacillus sp. TaxID=924 RepID=UPI002732F641|nr:DUF4259 domain-containing protein [Thiobacillus sp.]MDP3585788.1 DUF4259 domain-containing protein [Thiobacillus sp.]